MDTQKSLEGIKALKELLDMGAITQEEFESKKQILWTYNSKKPPGAATPRAFHIDSLSGLLQKI